MSVGQNLSLASIAAFTRGLFTSRKRESELVDRAIRDVHIKTDGGGAMIGSLSGGNQQKVVIGKMLATNPSVVLLDEPSRGIDIGAKSEVFKLLAEGARRGLAVVYSTSEVGECLSVAHRIVVMSRGKISAEFGPGATKEEIMAASGEVDLERQLADAYGLDHCEIVTDLLSGRAAAAGAGRGRRKVPREGVRPQRGDADRPRLWPHPGGQRPTTCPPPEASTSGWYR